MEKVLVLMSTYNGQEFVEEQINSVFNQIGVEVTLLIRDDGSSDNTVCLLRKMQESNPRIILHTSDNIGCANSFMSLLCEAKNTFGDFDFFAFCDQDDVWLPEKLMVACDQLKGMGMTKPSLYMGANQKVDSELNVINTPAKRPQLNLMSAFVENVAVGCTMVFNKCLLETLSSGRKPNYIIMHDYWVYVVCLSVRGSVFYDQNSHILHRLHANNLTGWMREPFIRKWSLRVLNLFKNRGRYRSRMAKELLDCYGSIILNDDKEFLGLVSSCNKWLSRMKLLTKWRLVLLNFDYKLKLYVKFYALVVTGRL